MWTLIKYTGYLLMNVAFFTGMWGLWRLVHWANVTESPVAALLREVGVQSMLFTVWGTAAYLIGLPVVVLLLSTRTALRRDAREDQS